jgi:hypothetical protein
MTQGRARERTCGRSAGKFHTHSQTRHSERSEESKRMSAGGSYPGCFAALSMTKEESVGFFENHKGMGVKTGKIKKPPGGAAPWQAGPGGIRRCVGTGRLGFAGQNSPQTKRERRRRRNSRPAEVNRGRAGVNRGFPGGQAEPGKPKIPKGPKVEVPSSGFGPFWDLGFRNYLPLRSLANPTAAAHREFCPHASRAAARALRAPTMLPVPLYPPTAQIFGATSSRRGRPSGV